MVDCGKTRSAFQSCYSHCCLLTGNGINPIASHGHVGTSLQHTAHGSTRSRPHCAREGCVADGVAFVAEDLIASCVSAGVSIGLPICIYWPLGPPPSVDPEGGPGLTRIPGARLGWPSAAAGTVQCGLAPARTVVCSRPCWSSRCVLLPPSSSSSRPAGLARVPGPARGMPSSWPSVGPRGPAGLRRPARHLGACNGASWHRSDHRAHSNGPV